VARCKYQVKKRLAVCLRGSCQNQEFIVLRPEPLVS